jgi:hypothetical protein
VWELSDKDSRGNAAQGAAAFDRFDRQGLVALEGVDDRGGGDTRRRSGVTPVNELVKIVHENESIYILIG